MYRDKFVMRWVSHKGLHDTKKFPMYAKLEVLVRSIVLAVHAAVGVVLYIQTSLRQAD